MVCFSRRGFITVYLYLFSDSRELLFLKQFPKNFLRPYGKVEGPTTTDVVLKRIKPDSCEWLRRPNVAMSELSETLTTNMELLDEMRTEGSLLSKKGVRLYKEALEPLLESVSKLNNKRECKGGSEDVKNVLKFLVGTEEEKVISLTTLFKQVLLCF